MPSDSSQIAGLVDQMPETDQDLKLVPTQGRPDPPRPSKFTGPDPDRLRELHEEILSGGQESVVKLLQLVRLPEDPEFKSYKAGYVVHSLVMHVGHPERKEQRSLVLEALVSQLTSDTCPTPTKAFFIRQLQLLGDRTAVRAIADHLLNEELCDDAAQALVAIRANSSEALGRNLSRAKGKARLAIIHALGALAEPKAVDVLIQALQAEDLETRLVTARALAGLGDAKAAQALMQLSDAAQGWERIQSTHCCLLLAEQLARNGKQRAAAQVYSHLQQSTEPHIRSAAAAGLGKLR